MSVTSEFEHKKWQAMGYIAGYYNMVKADGRVAYTVESLDMMLGLFEVIFDEELTTMEMDNIINRNPMI